jgi:hypothetical protein
MTSSIYKFKNKYIDLSKLVAAGIECEFNYHYKIRLDFQLMEHSIWIYINGIGDYKEAETYLKELLFAWDKYKNENNQV